MKENYLPWCSEMHQKIATKLLKLYFVREIFNNFYG